MQEYHLVIRLPILAKDDADARAIANRILKEDVRLKLGDPKLQAIYNDKAPRGVSL